MALDSPNFISNGLREESSQKFVYHRNHDGCDLHKLVGNVSRRFERQQRTLEIFGMILTDVQNVIILALQLKANNQKVNNCAF